MTLNGEGIFERGVGLSLPCGYRSGPRPRRSRAERSSPRMSQGGRPLLLYMPVPPSDTAAGRARYFSWQTRQRSGGMALKYGAALLLWGLWQLSQCTLPSRVRTALKVALSTSTSVW